MLIRPITYEDLDGNEVTETFHFHLSKSEIIDMEVEYKQGYREMIEEIIKTEDRKELVAQFKKLILMTYGVRSEDGKRFIKDDKLTKEFAQSQAFEALYIEFLTKEGTAIGFFTDVLPRDIRREIEAANAKDASEAPPAPTPAPSTMPAPPTGV